ncbi:Pentatricopeptide repeat-containing protein [Melia azedarach]|uniref:Pentatricopeptide repeat-containing protein n=1 Tax=Melia azedarach TaxID=155640 RepID=A0ACC1Z339_MELAZ|nr:Pentatricopeptide repeat-containing protein [Melia azedarach]
MLHCCSSGDLGHESIQHHLFSPSKLNVLHSPFKAGVFVGFANLRNLNFVKRTPIDLSLDKSVNNSHNQRPNQRGHRVSVGFELQCNSKSSILPAKSSSINGRRKKYGGVLPSILHSLKSSDDIEKTLNSFCENLGPKEQTVVLKEQNSWERVIRVFEFFKSQKEYAPNVIHYNIVLRALGRAQKWDELRLRWIDMAKNGVLPTNNTYGMLVDVYGKAGLVKESLLWIKHMKLRGLFPDEVTMNTVVRVLKEVGEFDRADRFYKDWCIGQVELDDLELDSTDDFGSTPVSFKHFLSTELFRTGGRNPIQRNMDSLDTENSVHKPRLTSTYNTLIDLYGKAGRLEDAANVFAEMLNSGVAMDTVTFNTMIHTCGSHGNFSEAEALLSKMEERGISPDTKTYNILLSLYADVGNIDAALMYYWKIREVGLFPDNVTHRAILHILCQKNMVQEVETVINEMEKSGLQIDGHSVPGVMKVYVNKGLLHQAQLLFKKCQLDGGLSSKTRAAIIDVYAEKGLWAEAEAVFYSKRESLGQKKDVVEYNVMIKAYGKAKLYDKAFALFKVMKNHGTWPDECTYNSLIQMFAGGDLVDHAVDLLAEMQEGGFKPQCLTFSSVIASYAHLGRLSDAVTLYQEMGRAGVKPNEVVYGSLINGFAETGKVEEALQYFRMMGECGLSANQIVMTSLIKAYSKISCLEGAKRVYEKMKDMKGGPDTVASNSMISLFADLGMVSEAESVFSNLREKGQADGVSFAAMMALYKSMGMLDEAIDVAEEMKQSALLRDVISYNQVMACFAANGQLRECGELLHEMVTKQLLPDNGTFKVLFTVLKKGGFPIEAVKQLESSHQGVKPYASQAVITSIYSVVGLHALALDCCESLIKAEVDLDSFVYNVAIYAFKSSGQNDRALNMFMKMLDQGLEPDLVTCINLVGCYGTAGLVEGVKRIHGQLKYGGIGPNENLFKAVIDAYKNANRQDLAEQASQEMRTAFEPQEDTGYEYEEDSEESFLGV